MLRSLQLLFDFFQFPRKKNNNLSLIPSSINTASFAEKKRKRKNNEEVKLTQSSDLKMLDDFLKFSTVLADEDMKKTVETIYGKHYYYHKLCKLQYESKLPEDESKDTGTTRSYHNHAFEDTVRNKLLMSNNQFC